jgi:tetratricopeptide (TPR) repeat protein
MRWAKGLGIAAAIGLLGCPGFAQATAGGLEAVKSALRGGEFQRAIDLSRSALKQSPDNAQLWTLQGIAFTGEKHDPEALSAFQHALKIAPNYLPALEGAAQIEYQSGGKEAAFLLKRVLQLLPNDPTSHAMLGVLAFRQQDCASALQHFEKSLPAIQSQPEAMREYGYCLLQRKQADRAVSVFTELLALRPEDPAERRNLADAELAAGRPQDAIATLGPLLQSSDPEAPTLSLAASAYEAGGNTPKAVELLRQAIVLQPRNVDLYVAFADIAFAHQSFQVGVDMINAGLSLQPRAAPLYLARGILYVQMAQYDKAESDFEMANQLDPAQSISSVAEGLAALQNNDLDSALAAVRSKLAKKPNDAYLLYLQADILTHQGPATSSPEFRQALTSAEKALALQPSLASARDVLAKLYMQEGKKQEAIKQCRRALQDNPKDQIALYHLVMALRETPQKSEIPGLLKRLAQLREQATKDETERNRYKLVEEKSGPQPSPQP